MPALRRMLGGALLALAAQGLAAQALAAQAPEEAEASQSGDYGRVGYAHITGPIDRLRQRYLERAIEDARAQSIDTLITHIDTDGGAVLNAREMFKLVLDQERDGPRMIAYVDFRAISAGALITYAHEAIYVSSSASIGDIGVIFVNREGEMEYAPEKIETVIRTLLVQAAELRGWDRALLLKMTARNQKLYRVVFPDGSTEFVIEDNLPDFLLAHPEIDKENERQVVVYRGEDRLLTLTGQQAVEMNMATALAADLPALYGQLGVAETSVIDLSPKMAETTAWHLAKVAPLLAGLAFLFVLFELKTPGVGWWAAIGGVLGALFLLSQYYLDMAENVEVVLMVLGLVLVGVEFFTMAGGGMIGIAGGVLTFTGLVMLFLPNELEYDFSDPRFLDALAGAAANSLLAVAVVAVGLVTFITVLPRTRFHERLAVRSAVSGTSAGEIEAGAETLIGRTGIAREALRPSGTVSVDGEDRSARCEYGAYAPAGSQIEVVRVEFGELVVRAIAPETDAGAGA